MESIINSDCFIGKRTWTEDGAYIYDEYCDKMYANKDSFLVGMTAFSVVNIEVGKGYSFSFN